MTHKQHEYSPVGSKNSTSGYAGVHWCKSQEKWIARITFRGQNLALGSFTRLLDALDAREKAETFYEGMGKLNRPSARFSEGR